MNGILFVVFLSAGQPPAKPPALPTIQPANAKAGLVSNALPFPPLDLGVLNTPETIVVVGEDNQIVRWKGEAWGIAMGPVPTPTVSQGSGVRVTAFASAKGVFALAGLDGKLNLYRGIEEKPAFSSETKKPIRSLGLDSEGLVLAVGFEDGAVQLFETASGKPKTSFQSGTDWIMALAFSSDGKIVAAGANDGFVRLFEAQSGKKSGEFLAQPPVPANTPKPPVFQVGALAFSPDGKSLACSGGDPGIHFFQVNDGKFIRTLPGHQAPVTKLLFHPSGNLLVSTSCDKTVKLWNPAGGNLLKNLEGSPSWITGASFNSTFDKVFTSSVDGTARSWELADKPKK